MSAFTGIITSEMKTLFTDAIDALLEDSACTRPCKLIYGDTKWTDCHNCFYDAIGQKSTNKYKAGGPMAFYSGICPYCHGRGRIEDEQTEELYMMVLWDYSQWVGWNGSSARTRYPDGAVQTMCAIENITKIKKAQEILVATDIEKHVHHRFTRDGEPNICGFGNSSYLFTIWKHMQ